MYSLTWHFRDNPNTPATCTIIGCQESIFQVWWNMFGNANVALKANEQYIGVVVRCVETSLEIDMKKGLPFTFSGVKKREE